MSIVFKGKEHTVPITEQSMYSDGTPMIKSNDWDVIVNKTDTVVVKPHTLNEFVNAMFLTDAVEQGGGRIDRLILPYLPGARQDRSNPTGDVLFTALSVADMINFREFYEVVSVDPHSPIMAGLINGFVEFPLERIARKMWHGYSGIIAPDKGAHLRAEKFATTLGLAVTYGTKSRDVSTGKLTGFDVTVEPGKHYLVVDDICDGGGTFIGLGDKIKAGGAFADLYVTHGIFSKGTDALKTIYKNIYTTDTRDFHERNDVMVVPVVAEMETY